MSLDPNLNARCTRKFQSPSRAANFRFPPSFVIDMDIDIDTKDYAWTANGKAEVH